MGSVLSYGEATKPALHRLKLVLSDSAEWRVFYHERTLQIHPARLKQGQYDSGKNRPLDFYHKIAYSPGKNKKPNNQYRTNKLVQPKREFSMEETVTIITVSYNSTDVIVSWPPKTVPLFVD